MCLSRLTGVPDPSASGEGWKVLVLSGVTGPQYSGPVWGGPHPPGEPLSATERTVRCEATGEWYKSGFHVFVDEQSAREYLKTCWVDLSMGRHVVRKVRWRGLLARGEQCVGFGSPDRDCVVVSEMTILEEGPDVPQNS